MAIKNIDAKTLKQWLDNQEVVVVDVRDPDERAAQSIPGSIHIPLAKVSMNNLPSLGDKKLVLHCGLGKRGNAGCEKLLEENPSLEVYNLEGGIKAWVEAGYPVDQTAQPKKAQAQADTFSLQTMSLEQQYQTYVGAAVLIFSLLGLLFRSIWLLIPLIIGGVMLYSGIMNKDYLGDIIQKLPWGKKKD